MSERSRMPKLGAVPRTTMSVAERARAIESACRAAMQLLASAPDREERLRRVDPLPASTRALLRSLATKRV